MASALEAVNNRGPGFDTIRLAAASVVVLHHAMAVEIDIVRDDFLYRFSEGYTQSGLMAVAVFFSISGFLVTPGLVRSRDVLGYLSRRFMRIMPLLAVVVLATALVFGPALTSLSLREYFASPQTWLYLKNVTTSLSLELPGVSNHRGSDAINSPLWTLRFEWLCYLALAALALIGALARRVLVLCIWGASQLLLFALFGAPDVTQAWSQAETFLYLSGYFGAGVVMYTWSDRIPLGRWLVIAAIGALIVALYAGIGVFAAPLLVTYLVIAAGLAPVPWSKTLAKADLSYGIYLTHSLVLTALLAIFPFTSGIALFASGLVISALVAFATWTFIERPGLEHKTGPAKFLRTRFGRMTDRIRKGIAPRPGHRR